MVWNPTWRLGLPGAQFVGVKTVTDKLPDGGALTGIVGYGARIRNIARKIEAACATNWTTAKSPVTLFTVTGDVLVRVFGTVQTGVTSTANTGTLEVGVAGNTAVLIAQTIAAGVATRLATGDVLTGVDSNKKALVAPAAEWTLIAGGASIILTVATNNMSAGAVTVYCEWIPLSANGNVVAA